MAPTRILVVEDDPGVSGLVVRTLGRQGYTVDLAEDGDTGLRMLSAAPPADLAVIDLGLPKLDGMEIIRTARAEDVETPLVVLTGQATVETAVEAMRAGADDFVTKPFEPEELLKAIDLALQRRELQTENSALRRELLSVGGGDPELIAGSVPMREAVALARKVAATAAPVLITGESGTGKSLLAGALHRYSPRAEEPFVAVSCATLPDNLVESELFGHEKGAFTGAQRRKPGRFELARGGSIFLDEIGELSLELQPKLLRVLQSGEYEPVGGTETRTSRARVIAATNRDLVEAVERQEFREDLYYRLDVVTVEIPPLRRRREDIPVLAEHFLEHYARVHGKHIEALSAQALSALQERPWPGNVRELENAIQRAVVLAEGPVLQLGNLTAEHRQSGHRQPGADGETVTVEVGTPIAEVERRLIRAALDKSDGNREAAAALLGISSSTLYRRLRTNGGPGSELQG